MRIVDVCAFYSPHGGGVRTYIHRKMKAAPALGHELIVLAPGIEERIDHLPHGSILHTIPSPEMPLDRRYHYFDDEAALHRVLDYWRPDHVEASSPWSSATMVGRWPGSATRSLVLHADPLASYAYRWFGAVADTRRIDRWFGWFWRHLKGLDRMFDVLVTPNDSYRRRLCEGGLGKVVTVPMGIDPGVFSPRLRSARIRQSWLNALDLGPQATLLVAVGRLSAEKRWPMVIDAVAEAGRHEPVGLVLVGDGTHYERLERRARRHSNTLVAGAITDRRELATLLASADGLVHGCESETFGLAACEAKASGIPIIVPDRGGAFSQVEPGRDRTFRSGDRRDMAREILDFARREPGLERSKKGARPARTLDQHFAELFGLYFLGLPLGDNIAAGLDSFGNFLGVA